MRLVRVDEDGVERAEADESRQHLESPALVDGDRSRETRRRDVLARDPRVLRVELDRVDVPVRGQGPRGANRRVAGERPDLDDLSRTGELQEELERLPLGGPELDGRHAVLFRRVERARERGVVRGVDDREPVEDLPRRIRQAGARVGIGQSEPQPHRTRLRGA